MTPTEFVACIVREKGHLLASYFDQAADSAVATQINAMGLSREQKDALVTILDGTLTDAFYTMLLGLDGAASIGGRQLDYELRDEDGMLLTGGELEAPAWEQLHGAAPE